MNFRTAPFQHQLEEFNRSALAKRRALFWEQGTGKTWYGINSMAEAHRHHMVDAAVIVAPSGVERNWITDELPKHMPNDIRYQPFVFSSKSAGTKWHKQEIANLLKCPYFPIFAISYDAWQTDAGKRAVWDFFQTHSCYLHVDESAHIKSWTAKRTQSLVKASPYAAMTRIYSGTPIDGSPFDMYSQIMVIDPTFWQRELDLPSWFEFQHFFGIFTRETRRSKKDPTKEQAYPFLVSYQNIGVLRDLIKKISSRVRKDDVLDLPPKLYTRRYYEMSAEQQRVYDKLENEYMVDFPDDPMALVTAELPIVRMLRLQQVLCGYVPVDGEDEPRELIDQRSNPRLDATTEFVTEAGNQQTIVWAQYTLDVDFLMQRLIAEGRKPVRYDGLVSEKDRAIAKEAFQRGDASDFVGKPVVGAEGLTLIQASTMAYHSNSYRYIKRRQSEDRAHRIGQTKSLLIGDMVCPGTRDERAIEVLQRKDVTSREVLGDAPKEWL